MRIRSMIGKIVRLPAVAIKVSQQRTSKRLMTDLYEQSGVGDSGERVLFWVPGGTPGLLEIEGMLAAALRLRGAEVHAVVCDGPFEACVKREVADGVPIRKWHRSCAACRAATTAVLERLGVEYSFIGDHVSEARRAELRSMTQDVTWDTLEGIHRDGLHLENNVRSSIIRFLKGKPLDGHEDIVAPYAFSATVCAEAAERAIERFVPTRLFMSHAVYVDWGPALSVSFQRDVPVVAWVPAYLQDRFYFRHIDDPVHSDLTKLSHQAWRRAREVPYGAAQDAALDEYMHDRYERKVGTALDRLAEYTPETSALAERYGLRPGRPTWGLMAHVSWDNVTDYAPMAYDVFEDWIVDTVERISQLDDVDWLVKIHPYEARTNPESGIQRLIERRFPSLPPHVHLIRAEEQINPLAFYDLVDGVVTVYGTGGLEMALLGKPVILAGEAYYGGKGFTHDGFDVGTYRSLLSQAGCLPRLSEEQAQSARRFAYTHFARRQIPLPAIHNPGASWWEFRVGEQDYWWAYQVDQRRKLLRGADAFLDFVCQRIVDGQDFVMDDDLVAAARDLGSQDGGSGA